jgi:AcrR family transcriptional regulator
MDTRQKLMQAASELILEVGFEGMTTAAVARRAGVSEGAIYRHFQSKEALAEAVFADIWRIFNDYMERQLPPRERPRERLEAFFKTTLDALDALMPTYGALCQQDYLHYTAKRSPLEALPKGADRYVALLRESIQLAQQAGIVRPEVDPEVAAHFFFFGAGQAMDFFGDPRHAEHGKERLPGPIFTQLEELMIHALYGARQ